MAKEPKRDGKRVISVRLNDEAISAIEKKIPARRKGFPGGLAFWIRNLVYRELEQNVG